MATARRHCSSMDIQTITTDLLNTIFNQDDSALDAWNRLERLSQGSKSTRALHLDTLFTTTKIDLFSGVKPYCSRIKLLSDHLRSVGALVSNDRMVLLLLQGLSADYKSFRTNVQHCVPLPPFEEVRSMLEFEEDSLTNDGISGTPFETAFFYSNSNDSVSHDTPQDTNKNHHNRNNNSNYKGKKNNCGRSGNNHCNNNRHNGSSGGQNQQSLSNDQ
ncbi:uncharacterized protein [Spinacia oleracea]|uniref:Uncharacterized protein n=1 Tax=Spinacia oleracea TaxID=3562 RepID=A0A9R0K8R0_SPIOL|nr:uncharacterized protein LOC110801688 [Spinacia oleracea]